MTFGLEILLIFGRFSDFYHTSRLSTQNGEICLQKYPPTSGNLSITNYLKQNAIYYKSHFTIENHLKVEISVVISKSSTTLSSEKNAWGTRRGVGRGSLHPKFLALFVILCFERRCRKQNNYCSLKVKILPCPKFVGWLRLGTRRDKHLKKLEVINAGTLPWKVFIASPGH